MELPSDINIYYDPRDLCIDECNILYFIFPLNRSIATINLTELEPISVKQCLSFSHIENSLMMDHIKLSQYSSLTVDHHNIYISHCNTIFIFDKKTKNFIKTITIDTLPTDSFYKLKINIDSFSNLYCNVATQLNCIIKISSAGCFETLTFPEDTKLKPFTNGCKVDDNDNVFMRSLSTKSIVKLNLKSNKITNCGQFIHTNGLIDCKYGAISFMEGAVYFITRYGAIMRIQGITDKKSFITKITSDYQLLSQITNTTPTPKITIIISDFTFTLHTQILSCRSSPSFIKLIQEVD